MEIANFGVEEWLNRWEKKTVYDIVQSSIEALTLDELVGLDGTNVSEFFEKCKNEPLDYSWIEGLDVLKQEVASLYQTIGPENVLQTNGATGADLLALYALVEAGDYVVSMLPTYQQLYDISKSLGATVDFVHLREEEDQQFDLEQLEALVKPETKVIYLNSANNPIGILLDRKTLEKTAEIARTVDAYVLIDEVYTPLTDKGEFLSIVDVYEKGIATNPLSKTYLIPGTHIGWTAIGPELAEVFRKYRNYTAIHGEVLSDDLAVHALKNKEKISEWNQEIIIEDLAILKQQVANEPKVELVAPNYVSTSFIKLIIEEDDQTSCISLLEETGVLLVPGSTLDLSKHARLGYCCKKETLGKGLSPLSESSKEQTQTKTLQGRSVTAVQAVFLTYAYCL